jgi:hypothetical protein
MFPGYHSNGFGNMSEHVRPYCATICVLGSRMGEAFVFTSRVFDIVYIRNSV